MNSSVHKQVAPARLVRFLTDDGASPRPRARSTRPVIGVLEGTGIGPQVIRAALDVLAAVEQVMGLHFDVQFGGPIGEEAQARFGRSLPDSTVTFCQGIFDREGAILSGPGGGRYVYDLRRHFDLFCKFVPVRPWPVLARVGRVTGPHVQNVDILFVRDNVGGVYQGQWQEQVSAQGRFVEHSFRYDESQVRRLIAVAARAAAARRGGLCVVVKDGGIPGISALWRDVGTALAREYDVRAIFMNADLAAYELVQHPAQFDVLVTPNLFGDILVDVAGVLQSSRGVTFSGNFRADGGAVYQTNHGCAHDLAGLDAANPAGQILSLAMLLRESFDLAAAADLVEDALTSVWSQGGRTADLAEPGCTILGTQAMADRVAREIFSLAEARSVA